MANVRTIFFDLDDTLVDHAYAQRSALRDVYTRHRALFHQVSCDDFIAEYVKVNDTLWAALAEGGLTVAELRIQRFILTLQQLFALTPVKSYNLSDAFAMDPYYRAQYERYTREIAGATRMLQQLRAHFTLGVISNGFTSIQNVKLDQLGWRGLFAHVILSEEVGAMKPHTRIFDAATAAARRAPEEIAFVGDHFANDVAPAKRHGWNAVWYNPSLRAAPDDSADAIVTALDQLSAVFMPAG